MKEDIYEQLRQAIDEVGVGFPKTTSGVEIRMLKKLFTEEEAGIYLALSDKLETPDEIAKRASQGTEKVAIILKHMTEKGLTFPKKKGSTFYYARAAFGFGIMEHQLRRMEKDGTRKPKGNTRIPPQGCRPDEESRRP